MANIETFVSVDVETDGDIPGPNSMIQLGAVAYDDEGNTLTSFSVNIRPMPGSSPSPKTLAWWKESAPQLWDTIHTAADEPAIAMNAFDKWLQALPGRPVFVGYPGAWDFMWTYWYLVRYTGSCRFGHACLDLRTYAYPLMDSPKFTDAVKRTYPKEWFSPAKLHTHNAIEDADEQGYIFWQIHSLHRDIAKLHKERRELDQQELTQQELSA